MKTQTTFDASKAGNFENTVRPGMRDNTVFLSPRTRGMREHIILLTLRMLDMLIHKLLSALRRVAGHEHTIPFAHRKRNTYYFGASSSIVASTP